MLKVLSFSFFFTLINFASAKELKLSDYKVDNSFTCTAKELDMKTVTNEYKNSVELMKQSLRAEADFAGHYYLVDLPTPKGDVYNYTIIDCLTGKQVANLPNEYTRYSEDNYINGYLPRRLPTSRLLIMRGIVTDPAQAENYQTEYYEMKDGVLKLIKKTRPEIAKPQ